MSNNKLYTLSYFRKRLKESDIPSKRLINEFEENDSRYWSILIDPSNKNLICTCYKFPDGNFHFSLQTENYTNFEIKTLSMEVIVKALSQILEERDQSDVQ